ncbi:MAG: hypothetical protein GY909_05005 [Oligoflexia bacterium]|nr:hypothetical protein [Oligoflexia bacterium]
MKKMVFVILTMLITGQVFAESQVIKIRCVEPRFTPVWPETNIEIDLDTSTMKILSTDGVGFIDKNKRRIKGLFLEKIDCDTQNLDQGIIWCRFKRDTSADVEFSDGNIIGGKISGNLQAIQITRLSPTFSNAGGVHKSKIVELNLSLKLPGEDLTQFQLKAQSALCNFQNLVQ